MNNQEIGKLIKQSRKGKMTQQELAEKIGKTESSIRKYEKGIVTIPLDVLEQIASALGTTAFALMGAEYFDMKYPNAAEEFAEFEQFTDFLKSIGFVYTQKVSKWHWEEDDTIPPGRHQVEDEIKISLSKDGHTAIFTEEEFAELQAGAKEAIEGRFYKKVLEQEKK